MCIDKRIVYTNARYLPVNSAIKWKNECNCGRCWQCLANLVNHWKMRIYYEGKFSFDNNSYCLFDTLTYNDKYVPHYSDFYPEAKYTCWNHTCFNREHVTKFLKRLRIYLTRLGYDVKDKLRYFMAAEYGTHPGFTHRPHYHFIFFAPDHLPFAVLSSAISTCWKYGRTDGIKYKGFPYVANKRYMKSLDYATVNKLHYLTKYLTKDSLFEKRLRKRVYNLYNILFKGLSLNSYKGRLQYKRLLRQFGQFHQQSLHFGEAAIDYVGKDYINTNGCFYVPYKMSIKTVPLGVYFYRKLYCEQYWFNGKLAWKIRDDCVSLVQKFREKYQKALALRLRSFRHLVSLEFSPDCLADYICNHRYRLHGDNKLVVDYRNIDFMRFNYSSFRDYDYFGQRFISDSYCGDPAYYPNLRPLFFASNMVLSCDVGYQFDDYLECVISEIESICCKYRNDMQNMRDKIVRNKDRIDQLLKIFN